MAPKYTTMALFEHLVERREKLFTCDACDKLGDGKSSSLLRKLSKSHHLKHKRNDHLRATCSGVNHKYAALESALVARNTNDDICRQQISSLAKYNQRLCTIAGISAKGLDH